MYQCPLLRSLWASSISSYIRELLQLLTPSLCVPWGLSVNPLASFWAHLWPKYFQIGSRERFSNLIPLCFFSHISSNSFIFSTYLWSPIDRGRGLWWYATPDRNFIQVPSLTPNQSNPQSFSKFFQVPISRERGGLWYADIRFTPGLNFKMLKLRKDMKHVKNKFRVCCLDNTSRQSPWH